MVFTYNNSNRLFLNEHQGSISLSLEFLLGQWAKFVYGLIEKYVITLATVV